MNEDIKNSKKLKTFLKSNKTKCKKKWVALFIAIAVLMFWISCVYITCNDLVSKVLNASMVIVLLLYIKTKNNQNLVNITDEQSNKQY